VFFVAGTNWDFVDARTSLPSNESTIAVDWNFAIVGELVVDEYKIIIQIFLKKQKAVKDAFFKFLFFFIVWVQKVIVWDIYIIFEKVMPFLESNVVNSVSCLKPNQFFLWWILSKVNTKIVISQSTVKIVIKTCCCSKPTILYEAAMYG